MTHSKADDTVLRNGLSYAQAAANCNRLADRAYADALAGGASQEQAQEAARKAFNTEMAWYES